MTPGQYSKLYRRDDGSAGDGEAVEVGRSASTFHSVYQNGGCLYEYETGADGSNPVPSSSDATPKPIAALLNSYEHERKKTTSGKTRTPYRHHHQHHRHHHHKRRRRKDSKGEDLEDDDDDRDCLGQTDTALGLKAVLCCILGMLVIVLLIILLCNYVAKRSKVEKEDRRVLETSLTFLDIHNDVYTSRIARLLSAQQDEDRKGAPVETSEEQSLIKRMGGLLQSLTHQSGGEFAVQGRQRGDDMMNDARAGRGYDEDCSDRRPYSIAGETRDVHLEIEVDVDDIIKKHSDMLAGGEWKPQNCVSRHRLAIIIPYRDRWNHLKVLLHYVLPLLKRQQIHFRIFVVEQYGNQTFNKGRIMNAAYREALKVFDFQCVIFHDVDLVPEDDRNIYTCSEHPMHMSTAIDKFNYHLPYMGLVGGVLSFRVDHFQLVNGYSNMYWGWGGEDDDMTTRILSKGLRIFRPPNNIARYKMVKHSGRSVSSIRLKLLRTAARRGRVEGLNNVPYQLMFIHLEKLFTHLMVDVGKP